ncbi:hypothetical protein JB92DRAFT_2768699 [Gautieria morchelliformis]|nr:hypothetical protein JB92DRAFT_2768699 [Gautieria morchelliformis]
MTTQPEQAYYADFGPADRLGSDIVLLSSEGVGFCANSFILKKASSVFRTTLSLPQPPGPLTSHREVQLSEDAQAINGVLRMISGMELAALDTFDEIEKVLAAAHKWEMPGPISIIRRMTLPPDVYADPLRFYVMACRFGWEEGAKAASALTNNTRRHLL